MTGWGFLHITPTLPARAGQIWLASFSSSTVLLSLIQSYILYFFFKYSTAAQRSSRSCDGDSQKNLDVDRNGTRNLQHFCLRRSVQFVPLPVLYHALSSIWDYQQAHKEASTRVISGKWSCDPLEKGSVFRKSNKSCTWNGNRIR